MEAFASRVNRVLVSALERRVTIGLGRDEGQTFVEYALILAFIAAALTGVLLAFQGQLTSIYGQISADVGATLP